MKCAVKSRNEKGKVKKTRERGKAEATEQLRARRKESLGSVLSWPVPLYQPHLSHLSTNKTLNNQSIHESRVLGPKRPRQNNQLYSYFFLSFFCFPLPFVLVLVLPMQLSLSAPAPAAAAASRPSLHSLVTKMGEEEESYFEFLVII